MRNEGGTVGTTLRERGYRMPAEWAGHAGTWWAWPHKEASWPGKLQLVPPVVARGVALLARGEDVHINVGDAAMEASARAHCAAAGADMARVHLHRIPTNDAWARDHGPIFVNRMDGGAGGAQMIVKWGYNAWGDKYPPYDLDNRVPYRVAETLGLPLVEGGMILEGGSIDGDGEGTLLTTESCLLNPNRNPTLDRAAIERRLRDYLGAERILWLGDGIVGDDTDGHVDDITRFVAPGRVVTMIEPDATDANHAVLADNLRRLREFKLDIVPIAMPAPVEHEGQRLPASYANFYIGNAVVVVPTFACRQDEAALRALEEVFSGREVAGVDCRDLIWGLGAFHCLTQQQPAAGVLPSPRLVGDSR